VVCGDTRWSTPTGGSTGLVWEPTYCVGHVRRHLSISMELLSISFNLKTLRVKSGHQRAGRG
jgi:hypothetical protein